MKLLLLLLPFSLLHSPGEKLVLIDRQLKNPAVRAGQITFDQYLHHAFPIYAEDLPAVIAAAETIAKKLEQKMDCNQWDTITARHTQFVIRAGCEPYNNVSVSITTRIDEQKIACNFSLVNKEESYRKTQRMLLDFSSYLSDNK
ncbi:MAG TPA: hypothetical protein VMR70_21660 [Flavisolibacter sp.]|nr:hypothetical protein [Flavisolibacter sp.]